MFPVFLCQSSILVFLSCISVPFRNFYFVIFGYIGCCQVHMVLLQFTFKRSNSAEFWNDPKQHFEYWLERGYDLDVVSTSPVLYGYIGITNQKPVCSRGLSGNKNLKSKI